MEEILSLVSCDLGRHKTSTSYCTTGLLFSIHVLCFFFSAKKGYWRSAASNQLGAKAALSSIATWYRQQDWSSYVGKQFSIWHINEGQMPRALNNAGEYITFFSLRSLLFSEYAAHSVFVCGNAAAERAWHQFV